jgi:hypothetical protein
MLFANEKDDSGQNDPVQHFVNANGSRYDRRTVEVAYNSMLKYKPIIFITSEEKSLGDDALRYVSNYFS